MAPAEPRPTLPQRRGASPRRRRGSEGSEPHVAPVGLRREEARGAGRPPRRPRRGRRARSSRTAPPTGSTGPGRAPPSTAPRRTRRPAPTPTRPRSIPSAPAGRSCCGRRGRAARCRTRAGSGRAPVSARSGSGAPGTSNSSRPRSSRNVRSRGRRRSNTPFSPVNPDHDCASATADGPNAARYRTIISSGSVVRSIGRPSHRSTVVKAEAPVRPQMPRGVTWTVGSRYIA